MYIWEIEIGIGIPLLAITRTTVRTKQRYAHELFHCMFIFFGAGRVQEIWICFIFSLVLVKDQKKS
jgi:hypothetical protein